MKINPKHSHGRVARHLMPPSRLAAASLGIRISRDRGTGERFSHTIFKSYDIRGIYPEELNEETAKEIGRIFAAHTQAKNIVVGRDCRLSSLKLFEALAEGITEQGANVIDIGLVSVDCVYFSVGFYGQGAGIMITASHNPKTYNGFKMVKRAAPSGEPRLRRGIEVVRGKEIFEAMENIKTSAIKKQGKIFQKEIWQDYLNHIFSFINTNKIRSLKVVIDAGNGMAAKVMPLIIPRLAIKVIPLNFELDGNFPNRSPNPLEKGASEQINKEIKRKKADFGFMFDGDADRIFLVDEKGSFIFAGIPLLLLAKYFLEKNPGAGIAYNLICSRAVPEFIKKWHGRPIRTKVGFVNVMTGMKENSGIMGGEELAGHYCFRDNFYSDSAFIAFLILLQVISQDKRKVSEIIKELNLYFMDFFNIELENKEKVLEKLKEKYKEAKQDYLDGVTIEYDDWWFNTRPSQTEPFLRLTIEANTKKLLKEKFREIRNFFSLDDPRQSREKKS